MAECFDEDRWRQAIKEPDWYIKLYPELKELRERQEKDEVRVFFEEALRAGEVALAEDGPDLDAERQPIDTLVIHHTSSQPGYRLSQMNAVQMLNVYVPYFNDPTDDREKDLKGQPLWSDHVRDGRPVFYLYHWLMRMDGSFERLLEDDELGWHAANWEINRRSVAICLDNDYESEDPGEDVLQKLARFIGEHYPDVSAGRIMGHKEVSGHKTVCPGGNFVTGWKQDLLRLVSEV